MNADHPQPPPVPDFHLVQPARVGVSADILAIENLFANLPSESARDALLREAGSTAESRSAFEAMRGLPAGAIELVLLTVDKEVAARSRNAGERLLASKKTQQDVDDYVFETLATIDHITIIYPKAYAMLKKYADDRNRQFVIAMRDAFERNGKRFHYEITEAVLPVNALAVVNVGLLVNLAVATNVGGAVKVAIEVLAAIDVAVVVVVEVATSGETLS